MKARTCLPLSCAHALAWWQALAQGCRSGLESSLVLPAHSPPDSPQHLQARDGPPKHQHCSLVSEAGACAGAQVHAAGQDHAGGLVGGARHHFCARQPQACRCGGAPKFAALFFLDFLSVISSKTPEQHLMDPCLSQVSSRPDPRHASHARSHLFNACTQQAARLNQGPVTSLTCHPAPVLNPPCRGTAPVLLVQHKTVGHEPPIKLA